MVTLPWTSDHVEDDGLTEELHDALRDRLDHLNDLGGFVVLPPVSRHPAIAHAESSFSKAGLEDVEILGLN